tara:strand:- start:755 stop:1468 length:714 start_codon:yes stop_codon:yes gene_type:complete
MSENKTGKYFKYAIGEIVLVMVGILLALQVNNWNEKRKQDRYEREMLIDIYSSLKSDYNRCQNVLSTLNKQFIANDSIIKFMENKTGDITTINDYFNTTSISYQIDFQISAYESLKSKGLDIISNDSLRKSLINLYDYAYPRILNKFSNYNIHLRNEWRPFMINNFQFKIESDNNGISRHPIDFDKLNSETKMENILILNRALIVNKKNNLRQLMNKLENILEFIRKTTIVDSSNNK